MVSFRAIACSALMVMSYQVNAEELWPERPISIVLSSAAGSSSDILMRAIFEPISSELGVPILPDYKPGAGTTLGATHVARQPADGYTFFLASVAPLAIAPHVYTSADYDPLADFAGVARLVSTQNVLYVNKDFPAATVADLVALAKAEPGKYNMGIGAGGSSFHMASVLFMQRAGIELETINYKSNALAVQAVLAGEVSISIDNLITVAPNIASGQVRPLAVTSSKRSPQLPDVPTMMEAGISDYDVMSWFGLVAPKNTPQSIIDRMSQEIAKALEKPAVVEAIDRTGSTIDYQSASEFDAYFRTENARWKPIVEVSGVTIQ